MNSFGRTLIERVSFTSNMLLVLMIVVVIVGQGSGARILGFFMFPSYSHQVVYQPIWRELSLRGHQVTVITPNPLHDPSLVNLTEIDVGHTYAIMGASRGRQQFTDHSYKFQVINRLHRTMETMEEMQLNHGPVKELLENEGEHFDLVMIECHSIVMYGLAARFNAPLIGISSLGVSLVLHDSMGNPSHPAAYPDMFLNFNGQLTFWERIESTFFAIWYRIYFYCYRLPSIDRRARKHFGQDIPHMGELIWNMSVLFLNVNPIMYPPRPLVPAVIQLEQMHIKPVAPLPTDLQRVLDAARQGVIYVSFGTNVISANLSSNLQQVLREAFGELPYTVLWKWESDDFPDRPSNVVARKWLPQQDVLAHPNVRVFVTQGGLQSMEEAMARGVPIVGVPFLIDQPMNVRKAVDAGLGVRLDPSTLTKDKLKNAIIEVATNSKYRNKAKEIRNLLSDKPMSGLEKAIWWIEYVIRHKGAPHLHSPIADLPWYQYLFFDLILAIILASLTSFYILKKTYSYITKQYHNQFKSDDKEKQH